MGGPGVARNRLDLVVGRTLLFVLMTGVIVTVFAAGVATVGREALLHNTAMSVLLGAVVAALVQPAYTWGRRGVDWLLFGDRGDPYRAVVRTARAIETQDLGVLDALVDSLRDALRLSYVVVADGSGRPLAVRGAAARRDERLPLRHRGAEVGSLTVARLSDVLTAADRRLLAGMTPLLGAVLDSMRREAQLRAVRERLITVHEEERRRLRRELHDGLGPTLAAASLRIDAARARLTRDAAGADAGLAEVQDGLREAVGEMRRLIDALRPAVLDQQGLVAAIRQHAIVCAPGMAVSVEGDPGELSAAVESAAYRIAVEAVTNAVRHSGARGCAVTLTRTGEALEVAVTDDGRGIGGGAEGVGLAAMRERAEELGGVLVVDDGPGCRIRATLPLGRPS